MAQKYEIIVADSVALLQAQVQIYLDADWELVGGPFLDNSKKPQLCQAVTRFVTRRERALTSGAVSENSDGSFEFGVPGDATA